VFLVRVAIVVVAVLMLGVRKKADDVDAARQAVARVVIERESCMVFRTVLLGIMNRSVVV
jgi:hypothetical protein